MLVKKIIGFTIALLFITALAGQVRINPKIGFHKYRIAEERTIDFHEHGGFIAGGDIRFGSSIYFQPGLYFITYNISGTAIFNVAGTQGILNSEIKFSRLRIPLVLGICYSEIERFAMRVHIGGITNLSRKVEDNLFNLAKDNLEDVAFGATAGLGLDIGIVTFGLDYDFDITDIWRNEPISLVGNNYLEAGGKNRTLIFTFGLLL